MKPDMTMKQLFDEGLKNRREVLGAEYVDRSINNANDFTMAFQHITTEWCWGYGWGDDTLPRMMSWTTPAPSIECAKG